MNPKNKALLAHLTPVGWLIALLVNQINKDGRTSFYLRQTFGLYLCFFLTRFIPDYYIFAWALIFVFWVYSFMGVAKNAEIPVPFFGKYFQNWFKLIS